MYSRIGMLNASVLILMLFLMQAASADLINLSNGGEVKGSIEDVTFLSGGKQTTHVRTTIMTLQIGASDTIKDSLILKDGRTLEGEFVSFKIKCVGGVLTYDRKNVKSVTIEEDPRLAALKELAAKRPLIKPEDAVGLLQLAQWCEANDLKPEAKDLARASLKVDPKNACAELAHRMLGDVLYEGEWVTPTEAAARKKALRAECKTCLGTGKIIQEPIPRPCGDCNGDGGRKSPCKRCQGQGRVTVADRIREVCGQCNGKGWTRTCQNCRGTGSITRAGIRRGVDVTEPCGACGGRGDTTCRTCKGTGVIPGTTTWKPCPKCGGD